MDASVSIIIITYNRPQETLELLQSIACQNHLQFLKEVIILNNCSSTDYKIVSEFIEAHPTLPFQYKMAPENLGVSKGRNYAIQFASAPVLFLIDDDAELQGNNCLEAIANSFRNHGPEVAIISYLVKYFDNGQIQQNVFPHKQFKRYRHLPRFEAPYFVGCAHGIRAEALQKAGGYPTDFFYGMEEYDLSYRLLDAGYKIWYESNAVILHKEVPHGRQPNAQKLQAMWINKCIVAWRYLPKRYFISTALMWSLQYLRGSGFKWAGFWKGWRTIQAIPRTQVRKRIKTQTLAYLQSIGARLWY
ncbi:MAG TPA: glycosyltransferase family 2 protein [Phnomibacter sp.]|nr:glycosyltransferase family 2 protein [Phnomibacter sp.]